MFYLILAILIVIYYIFGAPKTIKSTLNAILLVGLVALLVVLAAMSFIKILELPQEIFVVIAMIGVAYITIKDIKNFTDN